MRLGYDRPNQIQFGPTASERSLEVLQHKLLLPPFLLDGLEARVTEKNAGNQNGDDKYRHDALSQPGLWHSTNHGQNSQFNREG
jgi:hypothetical protein